MYFENRKHRHSWQFRWHTLFAFIILLATCLLLIGKALGGSSSPPNELGESFISVAQMLLGASCFYAVFAVLLLSSEIVHSLKKNNEKLRP